MLQNVEGEHREEIDRFFDALTAADSELRRVNEDQARRIAALSLADGEPFAFAGLWTSWVDVAVGRWRYHHQ